MPQATQIGGSLQLLASRPVLPVVVRLAGARPGRQVPGRERPTGRLRRRRRTRYRWRGGPARVRARS